jgi:hypothetical protein
MQRLVYSPTVNAWVKTDNGIIDISQFITAGSVNRKVNQVSGAELTVRNAKKPDGRMLFTEHVRKDGSIGPLLHPMDPIIITLTRLRGRPIQVFTGYCDSTPYLQLYPGTVTIRASCTLKRLMHTFWDPGLDFTVGFLRQYGWFPDPPTAVSVLPSMTHSRSRALTISTTALSAVCSRPYSSTSAAGTRARSTSSICQRGSGHSSPSSSSSSKTTP